MFRSQLIGLNLRLHFFNNDPLGQPLCLHLSALFFFFTTIFLFSLVETKSSVKEGKKKLLTDFS